MDEQDEQQAASGGGKPFWVDKSGCREAIDTLYRFLDGELTEERRHEIADHLDECGPCLDAFDFEAELKMVIAMRCRDQVPQALRQRVLQALLDASKEASSDEQPWE